MPNVVTRKINWTPVVGEDVVGYRIRVTRDTEPFSYDLPVALEVQGAESNHVFSNQFPETTFIPEGQYNVFITALDDGGNESDPLSLSAALDLQAPSAPASGSIE